jgi:RNA polymerase sigma factor (TIGR02999 family)
LSDADTIRISTLLAAARQGDPAASSELVTLLYSELKTIAAALLRRESTAPLTLQATALVNEAFVRLFQGQAGGPERDFNDRAHFFRAAARAMRNILIDRARSARVGRRTDAAVESIVIAPDTATMTGDEDLLALDGALASLERRDSRQHDVVMLRYFAGLTIDQTAEALGVSPATVKNEWTYARAWLLREMERGGSGTGAAEPGTQG